MSYICPIDEPTVKVFVYRNLHNNHWSVKAVDGEHKGRVIFYSKGITLKDAQFKVGAGRFRVRTTKRKNVHAGVVGTLMLASRVITRYDLSNYNVFVGMIVEPNDLYSLECEKSPYYRRVTYDPYTMNHFKYADTMEDVTDKNLVVVLDVDMKAYVYNSNREKLRNNK